MIIKYVCSNYENIIKMNKENEKPQEGEFNQNSKIEKPIHFPIRKSNRKTKKMIERERELSIVKMVTENVEDGLQVETFVGKGNGVVATKLFKSGDFVCEYAGELLDLEHAKIREITYSKHPHVGCYMFYFKDLNRQFCVDATLYTPRLGRLVNHSRNGNLVTKVIRVSNKPRLVYFAKKDIQIGEEITNDYGDRSKKSLRFHPWLAC